MTTTSDLKEYAKQVIKAYPKLESAIIEEYSYALSEIEEGGSESWECNLSIDRMHEITKGE